MSTPAAFTHEPTILANRENIPLQPVLPMAELRTVNISQLVYGKYPSLLRDPDESDWQELKIPFHQKSPGCPVIVTQLDPGPPTTDTRYQILDRDPLVVAGRRIELGAPGDICAVAVVPMTPDEVDNCCMDKYVLYEIGRIFGERAKSLAIENKWAIEVLYFMQEHIYLGNNDACFDAKERGEIISGVLANSGLWCRLQDAITWWNDMANTLLLEDRDDLKLSPIQAFLRPRCKEILETMPPLFEKLPDSGSDEDRGGRIELMDAFDLFSGCVYKYALMVWPECDFSSFYEGHLCS
jgi:hypothetical protein